jgi:hypothetical protein
MSAAATTICCNGCLSSVMDRRPSPSKDNLQCCSVSLRLQKLCTGHPCRRAPAASAGETNQRRCRPQATGLNEVDGLGELGLHLARPKPTLPLQLEKANPSRTGPILRLKITQARTVNGIPSTSGRSRTPAHAAGTARTRRCVAVASREAARPKRRAPAASTPRVPGGLVESSLFCRTASSVMACRSLTASTCASERVLQLAGRAAATNGTEEASSLAAALLDGGARGPAAGTAAAPAASGFLLCSGLAVAGPSARPSPVASPRADA